MEIVCADAFEYLDVFQANSIDLIILDPDYQDWDDFINRGLLEKTMRILKKSGNVLCFTKQPFDYNLRQAVNPWFRREIVWTFENGGAWCSKRMPLMSTQKIYWLTKSKEFYFNARTGVPYAENTRNFKRKSKVFGDYEAEGRMFEKSEEGVWIRDHLHYNKPNGGKIPAKPQELIDILVRCFSPDGGAVLDPFAGSGSTIFAAQKLGRDVFACEKSEERTVAILDKCFEESDEAMSPAIAVTKARIGE
jgi:site-specific DNA-methyltransferase (adenine-specific)